MIGYSRSFSKEMCAPISRRDFLSMLVPRWVTKRSLVAGAIGAGVMVAVAVGTSVIRGVGFLGVLKLSVIGLGLVCVLLLFGWIMSLLQRAFKKSPPVVQALMAVLFQFARGLAWCAIGAYAYARWQAAEEKAGIIASAVGMLTVCFFGEWEKRRTVKPPEGAPVQCPPSNPNRPPAIPHP